MAPLSLSIFNCKYFKGSLKKKFCKELLDGSDFLMIQEHWLYEDNFHKFDEIDSEINICKYGKSAMDPNMIRVGRPHGGCIILWRDNINCKINHIQTISKKKLIKVNCDEGYDFLLFNVYMPTDDRITNNNTHSSNFNEFQDVLAEISIICQNNPTSFIIAAGDFNSDFSRDSIQVNELKQFCRDQSLESCNFFECSDIEYSFECKMSGSRSLIDHVLVSSNIKEFVKSCNPIDSIDNSSDHIAINVKLNLNCKYFTSKEITHLPKIAWYKASIENKEMYKEELDILLNQIDAPVDLFECRNVDCTEHLEQIQHLHDNVIAACLVAGQQAVPHTGGTEARKSNTKPGWNEYCREKKDLALFWHEKWKNEGRLHNTFAAHMRRKSRLQYHYAIRKIDLNSDALKSERMAKNCIDNKKDMWKEAKQMKGNNNRLPNMVDSKVGDNDISTLFMNKFSHIFTSVGYDSNEIECIKTRITNSIQENYCVKDQNLKQTVIGSDVQNVNLDILNDALLNNKDIDEALCDLKSGKSDGNIGIYSDHFLNGTRTLWNYLILLFNSMLVHGFTPSQMSTGTIIPIIKNKRATISDSDNFRGICLQSSLCKLLDLIILKKEAMSLQTSELQFGFKKKLSSNVAATIVKETIDYYQNRGGRVYCLALDASKAFDRVSFSQLFKCMLERNMCPLIIRFLVNMYTNQKNRVQYNQSFSDFFTVTNGVKQGGVLSPTLFSIYVNELLYNLENSGYGCKMGDKYVGCVSYADDIIIICASLYGLKQMIKICESYALKYQVKFNGSKSKLMLFSSSDTDGQVDIRVFNETVEWVNNMDYLGFKMSNKGDDSYLDSVVKDFNCKFNIFMGDFQGIKSQLKCDLFSVYCTSYYGSNLCDLHHLESVEVQWRKALRRIWYLPWRTHCSLLYNLCNLKPPRILFLTRFIKYFFKNVASENSVVKYIFQSAIKENSRLGNNLRYILCKIKYDVHNLIGNDINFDEINERLISEWQMSLNENDKRISEHMLELIKRRDSLEPWILSKTEIQSVLDMLAVS